MQRLANQIFKAKGRKAGRDEGREGGREDCQQKSREWVLQSSEMFTSYSSFPPSRHKAELHPLTYLKSGMAMWQALVVGRWAQLMYITAKQKHFRANLGYSLLPAFLCHSKRQLARCRGSVSLTQTQKKTWAAASLANSWWTCSRSKK